MGMSAFVWMVGNIVWLMGSPLFAVAPWWIGFLVLMIAGERLELSRLRRPSATVRGAFYASASIIMIGLGVTVSECFLSPSGLLHLSLLLRVAGDIGLSLALQQWGGLFNALAILLFLINNVRAVKLGMKAP